MENGVTQEFYTGGGRGEGEGWRRNGREEGKEKEDEKRSAEELLGLKEKKERGQRK